jgi:hypothetical protein
MNKDFFKIKKHEGYYHLHYIIGQIGPDSEDVYGISEEQLCDLVNIDPPSLGELIYKRYSGYYSYGTFTFNTEEKAQKCIDEFLVPTIIMNKLTRGEVI